MPPRQRPKSTKPTRDEEASPPPKPSSSRKTSTRSRVSAACEACKKRKTKCTGEPAPCHLCEVLGTECIIDLNLDMRRRTAMQQTIDNSKSYERSLRALIDCIRDGDPLTIQSLHDTFVQDNISQQEMAASIQHWAGLVRSRRTDWEQDGYASQELDTPVERHTATSPKEQPEELDSDWPYEPPLQDSAPVQPQPNVSERLVALHRRLRDCSDSEGERVLAALLESANTAQAEESIAFSSEWLHDVAGGGTIDPELLSKSTSEANERKLWHPALQPIVGPLTRRASDAVPPRDSFGMSGQQRAVGRSSITTLEPHREPGITSTSYTDPTRPHRHVTVPARLQELQNMLADRGPRTHVRPAVTDLLIGSAQGVSQTSVPIYLVQPLLVPDDSAMSRSYTEFLDRAREMLANKTSVFDVLGANDDVVVDLHFRQRQENDKWDCAAWASEFARGFMEYDMYVRLASVFLITRLMQWLLVPTAETYARLPDMIKPTPLQRMMPHIGAIDLIPIPSLRDAMIEKLEDWLTPLAEAKPSVNWPYYQDDAVEYERETNSRRLTQRFVDHVSDYNNWSVDSQLFRVIPEVTGRIRTHR